MYAAMVNSPGLLKTYLQEYAAFREASGFTPVEQEIVFLAIAVKTMSNYSNLLFHIEIDKMFSSRLWTKAEEIADKQQKASMICGSC